MAFKPRIYISTGVFKSSSLKATLNICKSIGIQRIELSSGVRYSRKLMDQIDWGMTNDFSFLIHNYFPPPEEPFVLNLASTNTKILEMSRSHAKRAMDISKHIGAPFYSFHSGFAFHAVPSDLGNELISASRFPLNEAAEIFIESLKLLCSYANGLDIDILIENNVLAPMNLIDGKNELLLAVTAEDILSICRNVASERLGVLIDTGHLKISAHTLGFPEEQFISKIGRHIRAFHVSDNDGINDSNLPFNADAWFLPILRSYNNCTVVLESYNLNPEQSMHCLNLLEANSL